VVRAKLKKRRQLFNEKNKAKFGKENFVQKYVHGITTSDLVLLLRNNVAQSLYCLVFEMVKGKLELILPA